MTVWLEGKLAGPWVEEARAVIGALRSTVPLCLNLERLSFADDSGIDLLQAYRREGIAMVGASALIEGLLGARAQSSASAPDTNR